MLKTPLPVAGVGGIGFLADRLEKWPTKLGERNAALHVGQLIRMQEEIGTGGAGFRFMYAAFLQEAAPLLGQCPSLGTLPPNDRYGGSVAQTGRCRRQNL